MIKQERASAYRARKKTKHKKQMQMHACMTLGSEVSFFFFFSSLLSFQDWLADKTRRESEESLMMMTVMMVSRK
jgi:hypothetical protein